MRQNTRSLWLPLGLILLPLGEYLVLRYFQHSILQLPIGWPVGTDYDLALPYFWVHFTGLSALFYEKKPVIQLQKRALSLNLFTLAFLVLIFWFASIENWAIAGALKWGVAFTSVFLFGSCYFCFLNLGYFLSHPKRNLIPIAVLMVFSIFIFHWGFGGFWNLIAPTMGQALHAVSLPLIGAKVQPTFLRESSTLLIPLKEMTLLVGQGCGGGEGILLFLLCAFGIGMNSKKRQLSAWLFFIPIGICVLLFVNFIRLSILLFFGVFLIRAQIYSREIFMGLIHANLGWLLYILTMYPLFWGFKQAQSGEKLFTFKRLVKTTSIASVILLILFSAKTAFPAGCNQACMAASDCPATVCPICVGVCTGCASQADTTSCADTGSGASTVCRWLGGVCEEVPEISGVGSVWLYFLAFFMTVIYHNPKQKLYT